MAAEFSTIVSPKEGRGAGLETRDEIRGLGSDGGHEEQGCGQVEGLWL